MKVAKYLIISQVTSTITDNIIHALAMIMMLSIGLQGGLYATIAFCLPYIVFSPFAGELGDRFSKTKMILWLKISEIIMVALCIIAMHIDSPYLMLFATLLTGIQSSFISPARLGLIPSLAKGNILKLSSWMDGTTFMAVLLGTGLGLLRPIGGNDGIHHSMTVITVVAIAMYVIGIWSSLTLFKQHPGEIHCEEPITYSWMKTFRRMSSHVSEYTRWKEIWATSFFWGIASIMISEAEPIAVSIGLHPSIVRYIVPIMSIGIGMGSFFTALTGFKNILLSSIVMAVLCGIICIPVHHAVFIIFAILTFFMCFFGGVLSSVFYADMMENTENHTASILATNNICNSLIMLISSVLLIPLSHSNPRLLLFVGMLFCLPIFVFVAIKKKGEKNAL